MDAEFAAAAANCSWRQTPLRTIKGNLESTVRHYRVGDPLCCELHTGLAYVAEGLLELTVIGGLILSAVFGVLVDARGRFQDVRGRMRQFVGSVERKDSRSGAGWETVHGFALQPGDVSVGGGRVFYVG